MLIVNFLLNNINDRAASLLWVNCQCTSMLSFQKIFFAYAESTLIYILTKDIFVAVGAHYVRLVSKIIHQLNFQGSEENTK